MSDAKTTQKARVHNPTIVGISQARMDSSRLPGKTLANLAGRTVLDWHVSRVKNSQLMANYVVATSSNPKDDAIEDFCAEISVSVFRGSSEDVLSRFLAVAKEQSADIIVRMTADCPLIDAELIDGVIAYYIEHQDTLDYVCLDIRRYLRGFDVEVFSRAALEKVGALATTPDEREHVTLGIYKRPEIFETAFYYDANLEFCDKPDRICVDTSEDLEAVELLIKASQEQGAALNWRSIMNTLSNNPEIRKINNHIEQISV